MDPASVIILWMVSLFLSRGWSAGNLCTGTDHTIGHSIVGLFLLDIFRNYGCHVNVHPASYLQIPTDDDTDDGSSVLMLSLDHFHHMEQHIHQGFIRIIVSYVPFMYVEGPLLQG